jgi:hypothetical protein
MMFEIALATRWPPSELLDLDIEDLYFYHRQAMEWLKVNGSGE